MSSKQFFSLTELFYPLPLIVAGLVDAANPVFLTAACLVALLPWFVRWGMPGKSTRPAVLAAPLALLALSALLSLWPSYDPALSLPVLLTLLGSISLFFAIVNTSLSPWLLAKVSVLAAAALALYFIGQYAHFNYPAEPESWQAYVNRAAIAISQPLPGLVFFTPHVNGVAAFVEGALFINLALVWQARGRQKLVWSITLANIVFALLVSQSRGAWFAVALAMGVGVVSSLPAPKLRAVIGLTGVLLLIIASGVFLLWSDVARSRINLYVDSLYLFSAYPFTGIGLGDTFAMVYSKYHLLINVPFLSYTHNLFLTIGLSLGILGLLALLWLVLAFFQFVIQVEKAGPPNHLLFRAAWLGVTAQLGHGFTDATRFSNSLWAMPMLFALLALAVVAGQHNSRNVVNRIQPARRWVIPAGMGLLLLAAGWWFGPSGWYANLGAAYQTRADLSPNLDDATRQALRAQAITCFDRALAINPDQPTANYRLGQMALEAQNFDQALILLARAQARQPDNQAVLKALGLAYAWTGQLDRAEALLRRRNDLSEVAEELGTWSWWWGTQNRPDLSDYAHQMANRLAQ